jgi:hypothetical protein
MAAGRTEAGTMVGGGAMQSSQGGTTLIPQLGDSFLTRVMELSSENSDIAFRQDLARQSIEIGRNMVDIDTERQVYERMLTILNAAPQTGSGDSELIEMRKWVDQQFTQLIASLKDTLKKVQLLYQEVSQRSLQPSMIYTIVEPLYVDRVSTVSAKTAALLIGLAWCVYVGAIMVGLAWRGLNRPAA